MSVSCGPRQQSRCQGGFSSLHATSQASLQLDFIVVGGNIGGLSCAYALASAGHRVRVLEKSQKGCRTSWHGIRIPPNLYKILTEWGLGEELKGKSQPCCKNTWKDLDSAEVIGCVEWTEEFIKESGGSFLLMHYCDLYDMLYRLAAGAGAAIIHGADVVNVIPGSLPQDDVEYSPAGESSPSSVAYEQPCVVLVNGDLLHADIIVGVDGSNSVVRNAIVLSDENNHGGSACINFFTTTYDVKQMESDPDLERLMSNGMWDIWLGDGIYFQGYPIRNRSEYVLMSLCPNHLVVEDGKPEYVPNWTSQYPAQRFAEVIPIDKCSPIIKKMINLPSKITGTRYLGLSNADQWVHNSGTIVMMGDAAHPSIPGMKQSVALVVEDAAVFGGLFCRLRNWDQVPSLMEAFQDLRKSRSDFFTEKEFNIAKVNWLKHGTESDARNANLKRSMNRTFKEWDENMQDWWSSVCEAFGYNAMDEAANWWAGWGMLNEMAKKRTRDQMNIPFSVVQTTSEMA